jgi:hypothetical protein
MMIIIVMIIFHVFNSIQLFIVYAPSQQPQVQLQTQHSAVIGHYIMDKYNINSRVNYRNTLMEKKQKKMIGNDNYKHRTLGLRNKNIIIIILIIQLNW